MRKILIYVLSTFIIILLVSKFGLCLSEKNEVLKVITESLAKHVDAHKRQDVLGATAMYAEDVWWIGEDGFEVKSRKDFETMYAQIYKAGVILKELNYITEELTVSNDIAVQIGWYSMTLESQGQEDKSKYSYMVAWQRQQDDSWKVYRGMSISVKAPE